MAFAGRVCVPRIAAIEPEPRGKAAAEMDTLYAWLLQRNGE